MIIVALFGTIVEVVLGKSFKDYRIALRVITGSTFDIRSVKCAEYVWLGDQIRNYTKSIYMYKINNDHAATNIKQLFQRCSEGDTPWNSPLRNRETDLVLPKPKKEFLKRSFEYNGAIH
jgi:hypothetical protein